MTFPDIFDVKMLIVANIFQDFHHHGPTLFYGGGGGKALNMIMTPCNLLHGKWDQKIDHDHCYPW